MKALAQQSANARRAGDQSSATVIQEMPGTRRQKLGTIRSLFMPMRKSALDYRTQCFAVPHRGPRPDRQSALLTLTADRAGVSVQAPQNCLDCSVQLPNPVATMLRITVQTYLFWAGSLFGPAW